jgi:hypothetical protein
VNLFNSGVNGLFDLLFWPFSRLAPLWGLTVVSFLTGILMLWIFGLVSNQDAVRTIRDRVRGNLIAVRLFGDDLGLLFRLQGRLLRDNFVYLKYAVVPLLVMIVPVLLILVQLNLRFGARPAEPGEPLLVKVTLRDAPAVDRGVSLEAPAGVNVETPGVRIPVLREVAWRVRAEQPGRHRLVVRVGDDFVEKELLVGEGWGPTSTRRPGKGFFDTLLYPGEPSIRSTAVESIEVGYRPLELRMFGWPIHWLVFFFLLSIIAGFAFRRVLGVEI